MTIIGVITRIFEAGRLIR